MRFPKAPDDAGAPGAYVPQRLNSLDGSCRPKLSLPLIPRFSRPL